MSTGLSILLGTLINSTLRFVIRTIVLGWTAIIHLISSVRRPPPR